MNKVESTPVLLMAELMVVNSMNMREEGKGTQPVRAKA